MIEQMISSCRVACSLKAKITPQSCSNIQHNIRNEILNTFTHTTQHTHTHTHTRTHHNTYTHTQSKSSFQMIVCSKAAVCEKKRFSVKTPNKPCIHYAFELMQFLHGAKILKILSSIQYF